MIKIDFDKDTIEKLRYERFHYPHPFVQRKMETVLLKSQGLEHQEICGIVGICGNTLRGYLQEYLEGGIDRLKERHFYRPESKLNECVKSIETYFKENPPATAKEAASKIEALTGIKRGLTQIRKYLHKIGMAPRKVGMIPAKADPEKQAEYKKKL